MPLAAAYAIAKKSGQEVVFLKTDFDYYEKISEHLFNEIRKLGKFEQYSIDEGFMELDVKEKQEALEIAEKINKIVESFGLSCSIGIADTMVTAKIASGQKKGILFIEDPLSFLAPLDIREMLGVGKKTEEILRNMGINTIGELAKLDIAKLIELFGKEYGGYLFRAARNLEKVYYVEKAENQISRIVTMKKDSNSLQELEPYMLELAEDVLNTLIEKKKSAKGIQISGITTTLKTISKRKSLHRNTDEKQYILAEAKKLLNDFCTQIQADGVLLRRIGFAVFDLADAEKQSKLFP